MLDPEYIIGVRLQIPIRRRLNNATHSSKEKKMSRKRVFRTEGPQEPKADLSLSRDERGLDSERPASPSRRGFLYKAGGIAAATTAAATLDPELLFATTQDPF